MIRNGSDDDESAEGSKGPPTPKSARIDEDELIQEAVLAYAVSIDDDTDLPTTYAQAMASDDAMKWREAMNAELRSHEDNRTWTLKPGGKFKRTIGSRWVFVKKRDQNGDVVRYKAWRRRFRDIFPGRQHEFDPNNSRSMC
ncbi:putative polyprotein [Plasmopara halstedii]|uniref:Putative polyprotein n=1 Tax=Plasmopara halstedii TaxID=4781 RepID=A0A0P1A567_PLAHL|nr:putative polyprotein [Plasmopara halstedii]CEG35679.1 putative polyprotein [Plasmopara halstedii]|eukprot:XP_024572048.1 putative polyprotein [Plasmopara halstedii]